MQKDASPETARIDRAVKAIVTRAGEYARPRVGIVLGSGLGGVADAMAISACIPYAEIPGFPASGVDGHAGRLCLGSLSGKEVAVMQGRVHLYEGHRAADVVLAVRVLVRLGASSLIITNAAGAVHLGLSAGDLMLIQDHLNLTGENPLVGPSEGELGPRFPDMSQAYDPGFLALAKEVGNDQHLKLKTGIYAGLLGPSYETPAEVRMLRGLGADAVGMSTVLEVVAAHHMGAKILGISCISNLAAGLTAGRLSHEEVKQTADAVTDRLTALIRGTIERITSAV